MKPPNKLWRLAIRQSFDSQCRVSMNQLSASRSETKPRLNSGSFKMESTEEESSRCLCVPLRLVRHPHEILSEPNSSLCQCQLESPCLGKQSANQKTITLPETQFLCLSQTRCFRNTSGRRFPAGLSGAVSQYPQLGLSPEVGLAWLEAFELVLPNSRAWRH